MIAAIASPTRLLEKRPVAPKAAPQLDRFQSTPAESWKPYKPTFARSDSSEWQSRMAKNANYTALSPQQRQQLDSLASKAPTSAENLQQLLDSQRLCQKDKSGQSVMDHLSKYQDSKVPEGFDKAKGFQELVGVLAEPGQIKQGNYSCCAQTTVEYIHAKDHPADYARTTVELLTQGQAKLANGDTMPLNPSSIAPDASGRTSISRVYQSSLSDYANGSQLGYDNTTQFHGKAGQPIKKINDLDNLDENQKPREFGVYSDQLKIADPGKLEPGRATKRLLVDGQERLVYADSVEVAKHGGLSDEEARKAMEAVTGKTMESRPAGEVTGISFVDRFMPKFIKEKALENNLQNDLKKGETVYVALNWASDPQSQHGNHALAVEKIENGMVYLRNPWGDMEDGKGGPARTLVDGKTGRIAMTLEEFHSRFSARVDD